MIISISQSSSPPALARIRKREKANLGSFKSKLYRRLNKPPPCLRPVQTHSAVNLSALSPAVSRLFSISLSLFCLWVNLTREQGSWRDLLWRGLHACATTVWHSRGSQMPKQHHGSTFMMPEQRMQQRWNVSDVEVSSPAWAVVFKLALVQLHGQISKQKQKSYESRGQTGFSRTERCSQ